MESGYKHHEYFYKGMIMANPDNAAGAGNPTEQPNAQVPAGTPEEDENSVEYWKKQAEVAEQRRRDTQSSYTKNQQALKAAEAKVEALSNQLNQTSVFQYIAPEVVEELEELKLQDPDKWRERANQVEQEALAKAREEVANLTKEVGSKAESEYELDRRVKVLDDFNKEHPDFEITDDLIKNEIPPRIVNKMETGEVTFEGFLEEVYQYVTAGKKVKDVQTPNNPNLSTVGGGNMPSKEGMAKNFTDNYANLTF